MRKRGRTDGNQKKIVEHLRAAGCNVRVTSALGDGFCDAVAYRPATGLLRLLEIKDDSQPPSKRKLTPKEEEFAREFPVWVVNNVKEALAAMELEAA